MMLASTEGAEKRDADCETWPVDRRPSTEAVREAIKLTEREERGRRMLPCGSYIEDELRDRRNLCVIEPSEYGCRQCQQCR